MGEVALGSLRMRTEVLSLLDSLPRALLAQDSEVRLLVEQRGLAGQGVGWVDVHLCAATLLTPGTVLWTRQRRLRSVAAELGVLSSHG